MRIRLAVLVGIAAAALAAPCSAVFKPGFPKEEFAARRAQLYAQIPDGVAIFLGAQTVSNYSRFRQNNNFFYYSGVEVPDSVLVLDGRTRRATLYVPLFSQGEINVEGPRLAPGADAVQLTGLESVQPIGAFTNWLTTTFGGSTPPMAYLTHRPEEVSAPDQSWTAFTKQQLQPWDGRVVREARFISWFRERFPFAATRSYDAMVHAQRRVKTAREIDMMRNAARLTAQGAMEAIRSTEPGMIEYQVAAIADFVYAHGGAKGLAFPTIVASGPNTVTWHYLENDREMKTGDLVLMDTGAEVSYYGSDVTRTWPVGGRFTAEQEKVYRCVLEASNAIIAAIKPGVTVAQLSAVAKVVYEKHGFGPQFFGYVGHYVGMAAHDVGDFAAPFVPGVIFNVEPILEFRDQKIHIRLEDPVLVTATGSEKLSRECPAELDALYRLYDEPSAVLRRNK